MTQSFFGRFRRGVLILALVSASSVLAEQATLTRAIIPESLLRRYYLKNGLRDDSALKQMKLQTLSLEESTAVSEKLAALPPHKPIPLVQQAPLYPRELREKGITGTVEAMLLVSSDGTVSEVYLCAVPHPDFAKPVAIALKRWRFKPSTSDFVIKVPIPFEIAPSTAKGKSASK